MDVVTNKLDGTLIDTNNPTTYDLSGDTFFGNVSNKESINYLYLSNTLPDAQVASCFKILEEFLVLGFLFITYASTLLFFIIISYYL
jgi:hypothetical protein